ncbi:MAG: DUF5678 domain-containing protein [Methanomassiliicoccales archaeon]|nr:DUF5678 domain-containing protein [Methanomassiliicoccales archaeon]
MNEEPNESDEDMKNDMWLKDAFLRLVEQYPRNWIAVIDRKVVAAGATRSEVEEKAIELGQGKEYSIYFIPPTGTFTDVMYARR